MQTIIIGDTHGRTIWQSIVNRHPDAAVVFLGDYFDSKENISAASQIANFQDIICFRREKPDQVTLLTGNHDFHYLPTAGEKYSGYQAGAAWAIQDVLVPAVNDGLLQICVATGKYLMSHAGFTSTWCSHQGILPETFEPNDINMLWMLEPGLFRYSPGKYKLSNGNEPEQGPLWVRPESLQGDGIPGWVQVVGHTQMKEPLQTETVICIDVLAFAKKYLIINTNETLQIGAL